MLPCVASKWLYNNCIYVCSLLLFDYLKSFFKEGADFYNAKMLHHWNLDNKKAKNMCIYACTYVSMVVCVMCVSEIVKSRVKRSILFEVIVKKKLYIMFQNIS